MTAKTATARIPSSDAKRALDDGRVPGPGWSTSSLVAGVLTVPTP